MFAFEFALIVALTALFCRYLLVVFFDTPSPAQWLNMLRRKKNGDDGFMYTRDEFDDYVFEKFPYFIRSMLGCPYCLSLHLTFVVAAVMLTTPLISLVWFVPFWLSVLGLTSYLFSQGGFAVLSKEVQAEVTPAQYTPEGVPLDSNGEPPMTIRRLGVTLEREPGSKVYKIVGQDSDREVILQALKTDQDAPFTIVADIQKAYRDELEALKERNPACPPCEQNALLNKYYEIMKRTLANADTLHNP